MQRNIFTHSGDEDRVAGPLIWLPQPMRLISTNLRLVTWEEIVLVIRRLDEIRVLQKPSSHLRRLKWNSFFMGYLKWHLPMIPSVIAFVGIQVFFKFTLNCTYFLTSHFKSSIMDRYACIYSFSLCKNLLRKSFISGPAFVSNFLNTRVTLRRHSTFWGVLSYIYQIFS